jgi:hypothetical protein
MQWEGQNAQQKHSFGKTANLGHLTTRSRTAPEAKSLVAKSKCTAKIHAAKIDGNNAHKVLIRRGGSPVRNGQGRKGIPEQIERLEEHLRQSAINWLGRGKDSKEQEMCCGGQEEFGMPQCLVGCYGGLLRR